MHHELFLALLGHAGDVVEAKPEGFFVRSDLPFLSKSQKTMINRLMQMGHAFASLERFVRQQAPQWPSLYARALAQGIERVLQRYADAVVQLETKVLSTGVPFPIPQMVYELEAYAELLPELHKLVRGLVSKDQNGVCRGAQLLDLLHRASDSGFPRIRSCMQELEHCYHRILFKQMLAWILYGEIVDPYGEFFIKSSGAAATTSHQPSRHVLDLEAVPLSFFPIAFAENVFFIGKSMQILMQANDVTLDEAQDVVQTISALANRPVFDTMAMEHALEKFRLHVAGRLYQEVVVKAEFVRHLKTMKEFFLLARGELFQAFIERSYAMMTMKPTHKSEDDLNHGVWQQSLRDFRPDDESWGQPFSMQLPLQTFSHRGFAITDGLVLARATREAKGKYVAVSSSTGSLSLPNTGDFFSRHDQPRANNALTEDDCGALWWRHVQFDSGAFSSEIAVQLQKNAASPTLAPHGRIAVLFRNRAMFEAPSCSQDGSFHVEGTYLSVECEIAALNDGELMFTCWLTSLSGLQEQARTGFPSVAIRIASTATLFFQLQYSRQELKAEASGQVTYRKVLSMSVNSVHLMETPLDLQQALRLTNICGEYWLGLAFTPSIRLTEWHLERFTTKTARKEVDGGTNSVGLRLKDTHQAATPRELWRHLGLRCEIPWPLQLLITSEMLRSYSHLFQFCFRLKRVAHALERTWKCSVLRAKSITTTALAACLLRGRMSFVVRNMEMYFQVFVIEGSFSKCLEAVEEAADFDKVKRLHENFVAGLVRRCYVHSKTVASAMDDVMDCCWRFAEYVLYQDSAAASGAPLSMDRIAVLDQEFYAKFEFFYSVLQHSDARDLIFLLDFDEFFTNDRASRRRNGI